ncbi:MAG: dihydroxyacetone kinase subunit DhaK, partial [Eubacteriales bacterium]|nr:dihydroxyacetone kinase subunit DhaK [Eubacteriales bacterium]
AIANVRSMGMAMSPCILPAVGKPGFELAENEVEIGMGIHGEPGVSREKISSAAETSEKLVARLLEDMDFSGSEVAVMVNGLGGTPLMELYIVYNEVERILLEKGIRVFRSYIGNYMTSLEMSGCSITLLKLDEELKGYLAAPAVTPAFHS